MTAARWAWVTAAALGLALLGGAALAQENARPARVVAEAAGAGVQEVPLLLTLRVPLEDGEAITVTAPVTVSVAIEVRVAGAELVSATARPAAPAAATASGAASGAAGELVDNAGVPYAVQEARGLAFGQVTTREWGGGLRVVGELTNTGDEPVSLVIVAATFYDGDGRLLDSATGLLGANPLEPGASAPFDVLTGLEADEVGSYTLRIGP